MDGKKHEELVVDRFCGVLEKTTVVGLLMSQDYSELLGILLNARDDATAQNSSSRSESDCELWTSSRDPSARLEARNRKRAPTPDSGYTTSASAVRCCPQHPRSLRGGIAREAHMPKVMSMGDDTNVGKGSVS